MFDLQKILKRHWKILPFVCLSIVSGLSAHNIDSKNTESKTDSKSIESNQMLIKNGTLGGFSGDSKIFSGKVSVDMMFKNNEWLMFSGALVSFEPHARSAWHTHSQGQVLVVTQGEILSAYKAANGEIIAMRAKKGDVILCPPNVEHFHGASEIKGAHIALTQNNNVAWLEKVSDSEYKNALKNTKETK